MYINPGNIAMYEVSEKVIEFVDHVIKRILMYLHTRIKQYDKSR